MRDNNRTPTDVCGEAKSLLGKSNFLDPTIVKAMLQGTIRNDDF